MIFDSQHLNAAIDAARAEMPAGHTSGIVGTVDASGAQVVLLVSRPAGAASLEIVGTIRHDWNGDNQASAKVIVSW